MKQASQTTILLLVLLFCTLINAVPLDKRGIAKCYKKVRITQYWIPKEGDVDMRNDGKKITLNGSKTKSLKTDEGKVIAKVSKNTYEKFQMEGTGLLKSGVMVNLDSGYDRFMKLDRKKSPYGLGSNSNGLVPWVSVAANDIKKGTTLYIKELNGLKLPDGKVHNGCVRVDDEGWSLNGCQIDFFVLQYSAYKILTKKIPKSVTVKAQKCTIKNYVTSGVRKWAVLKK
ncbi:hypothetical protein HPULCUR_003296 [Helicostylum pulchrum]|uniref:YkuD domain-containing protein n=1 Tax=Helicostylum pulchrum TaxID=562976 RepID=A0ABP9XU94_9FUNG